MVEKQGRGPNMRPWEWAMARLLWLEGEPKQDIARRLGRHSRFFGTKAAAKIDGPEKAGERVRLIMTWQKHLALDALARGELGEADKRARVASLIARMEHLPDPLMEDAMETDARGRRRKHIDKMSEEEIRDEVARLLGIERKTAATGDRRRDGPEGGADAGATPLHRDGTSGAETT